MYQSNGEWVVSNVQRTEDWSLDLLGNWAEYDVTGDETTSEDRTHNVLNQISAIDQASLTYDLQGNLADDGTQKYVWDVAGRLKEVRDSQDALVASFQYDAYGRRVTKDDGDNVFHYYYDGWRVIEEYTDDGENTTLSARNVWGLYLDETIVRTSVADGKDYYPVLNPIYSPLRIYDGNGALAARAKYTPYGKATLLDSQGQAADIDLPQLFTGQRRDVETALYYYKNRYHSPSLGRFLRRDIWPHVWDADNAYHYCRSCPMLFVDSMGLLEEQPPPPARGNLTYFDPRCPPVKVDWQFSFLEDETYILALLDDPCCLEYNMLQMVSTTRSRRSPPTKWHADYGQFQGTGILTQEKWSHKTPFYNDENTQRCTGGPTRVGMGDRPHSLYPTMYRMLTCVVCVRPYLRVYDCVYWQSWDPGPGGKGSPEAFLLSDITVQKWNAYGLSEAEAVAADVLGRVEELRASYLRATSTGGRVREAAKWVVGGPGPVVAKRVIFGW